VERQVNVPTRILLDTNVLSELMRPRPEPAVLGWFAALAPQTRFVISAITQAEILLGIALLPAGKKRATLADVARAMFEQEFQGMNLPFTLRRAMRPSSHCAVAKGRRCRWKTHRSQLSRCITPSRSRPATPATSHSYPA
jgi:toxin FitB